jgi:DNA polymerase III delta prime subunit
MGSQQLSLSTRPRRFKDMFGQQDVTQEIVNYYNNNENMLPVALSFTGPSGVGKTSLARLCALSLECTHSTEFGKPCNECYWAFIDPQNYSNDDFNIDLTEINCGDMSADELRSVMRSAVYAPNHGAKYRTYILDELQSLSKAAQRFLLKILEDSPESSKFYLCTTDPDSILEAIRGRCVSYGLRHLNSTEIPQFVEKLLHKAKSDLDPLILADLLEEHRVRGHRAVVQAVTKYLSGATPEAAAAAAGLEGLDTGRACRYVVKGDWQRLRDVLQELEPEQARLLRGAVVNYLKAMLFSDESGDRRKKISKAIARLTQIVSMDNSVAVAAVSAGLYDITSLFSGSD